MSLEEIEREIKSLAKEREEEASEQVEEEGEKEKEVPPHIILVKEVVWWNFFKQCFLYLTFFFYKMWNRNSLKDNQF